MILTNIQFLFQTQSPKSALKGKAMQEVPFIENAWLSLENDRIKDFGKMEDLELANLNEEIVDLKGKSILPSYVDSHTHLVFATSREEEFEMRIKGRSYEEIAAAGGGILNSADKLGKMDEASLLEQAKIRLKECIGLGTGAIEIKSGYGLNTKAELKMLRVIQELKKWSPIPIKSSFLGAHFYPRAYKENHQAYLKEIIDEMLPKIAEEGLADYMDVFCEAVAFSAEETDQLLSAAAKFGLKAKIHTNQFNSMGGIETAIKHNALSVDHLEVMNDQEIKNLAESNTIATLLPSAPFFLSDPYQPARKIIDANIPVALASDFNPGSSPSSNMNFVLALACVKLNMSPEEAINACTINGAFALELENDLGSIAKGKKANFIVTKKIKSLAFLPYSFGNNFIDRVYINGKEFKDEV